MIVRPITWWVMSDWFEQKTCRQHRYDGACYCLSGRKGHKRNPCKRTQAVADACKELAQGERPSIDLDEIETRAGHHRCKYSRCNHKGCIEADVVLDWLATYRRQQAA